MNKLPLFLKNTQLLVEKLGIVPLLYGSLGLECLTGTRLGAEDIDILIPRVFLTERWEEFQNTLQANGYRLVDLHEHTFTKDGVHYAYGQIEELQSFAGIRLSEIETRNIENISFRLLTLQQYLKVYLASAKDGYRINVRQKKDAEKIALIKDILKKESQ